MPATLSTLASPPEESATARILATAGRHLFTYGYNALTMDDLARIYGERDPDMVFVTPAQLAALYRQATPNRE